MLQYDDVMKLDFGTHIDGNIIECFICVTMLDIKVLLVCDFMVYGILILVSLSLYVSNFLFFVLENGTVAPVMLYQVPRSGVRKRTILS